MMKLCMLLLVCALGWTHGFNGDMICKRLRGKCIPDSDCQGKKFAKIPCSVGGNKCCVQRRRVNDVQTKPPTVATTMKPAIKATRLSVVDCGQSIYSNTDLDKRILGGHEAKPGQWPWLVSLRDDGIHQCGGSIINRQWILTAAHCFKRTKNPSSWTVVAGEHDASISEGHEVEVSVNRIFINGYDDFTRTNDIALMLLDEPLPDNNDWINEICMPTAADIPAVGDVCYLMGWGYLSNGGPASDLLQQITMPILDQRSCVEKYNKTVDGERSKNFQPYIISGSQICAGNLEGGKDTCQGDSGGPLTCRRSDGTFFQAGLTSYSIGCGYERTPGVYTKTAAHLDWIRRTIEANTDA